MAQRIVPGARGFTLLELLVAITLLGLLAAALLGGLRLGIRAWETSEQRLEATSQVTIVQDFLRERLVQAYPLQDYGDGIERPLAFEGAAGRLSFVTLMPEHLGAGFHRMVVGLVNRGGVADLALTWWPSELTMAAALTEEVVHERVLLTGIAGLEFAYLGALQPDQPPLWQAEWHQAALPLLIRVRVGFAAADGRQWPDLFVHPAIDGQWF